MAGLYRVTLVIEYLGCNGNNLGSQAISAWQRAAWQKGAWQDWLDSYARWWNIQINFNPTQVLNHQHLPSFSTKVSLKVQPLTWSHPPDELQAPEVLDGGPLLHVHLRRHQRLPLHA